MTDRIEYDPTVLYKEEQKFNQPWLWILLISLTVAMIGIFGFGLYKQLIEGEKFGNHPMSDTGLIIVTVIVTIFVIGMDILFFLMKLITRVKTESLEVQFFPLLKKQFKYEDIATVKSVIYNPIKDCGGWGVKRSKKGMVYNVSGNRGIEISFHDGKTILVGSQNPEQLEISICEAARYKKINTG